MIRLLICFMCDLRFSVGAAVVVDGYKIKHVHVHLGKIYEFGVVVVLFERLEHGLEVFRVGAGVNRKDVTLSMRAVLEAFRAHRTIVRLVS